MLAQLQREYQALVSSIEQQQYELANERLSGLQQQLESILPSLDLTQLTAKQLAWLHELEQNFPLIIEQLVKEQQQTQDELNKISHNRSHLIAKKYSI